jgi:DNA mismatch repair protein MutS
MVLDTETLRDLEIVPTPMARGATLWSMIDRTRTRLGGQALRQCLLAPPHTVEEILGLQRAHQLLADDLSSYRAVLDRADLDGVESYSKVSWQLPADMPRPARFRKWYRQYLRDVAHGQVRVAGLLAAAADLQGRLLATDSPVLRRLGEELATLLDAPEMRELLGLTTRHSSPSLREFDQLARDRARHVLLAVSRCIGRVEALWSVGAATREHGWTYPRPSTRLCAVGLVHPFLGPHAVPNDLHLSDLVRVCFVTGPNMAGKSTFLKAVAIAVLLAHMGCGVPASSMEFPVVATVFSNVNIEDNLGAGESFYLAEVRRIAALARALCDHGSAIAVVDEPFRGTNVHDAAEATLAVITRLAVHPAALVFVASHVAEVVPAILDDPGIVLFHFAADVTEDQPRFDYRLRDGMSAQRLGMTLLRQEGVLELLDRSAKSADMRPNHALAPTARA